MCSTHVRLSSLRFFERTHGTYTRPLQRRSAGNASEWMRIRQCLPDHCPVEASSAYAVPRISPKNTASRALLRLRRPIVNCFVLRPVRGRPSACSRSRRRANTLTGIGTHIKPAVEYRLRIEGVAPGNPNAHFNCSRETCAGVNPAAVAVWNRVLRRSRPSRSRRCAGFAHGRMT